MRKDNRFLHRTAPSTNRLETIQKDPKKIRLIFRCCIYQHNPEDDAYEKFDWALIHLVSGALFQNTNFPPGHNFQAWTIEKVGAQRKAGISIESLVDGDWS